MAMEKDRDLAGDLAIRTYYDYSLHQWPFERSSNASISSAQSIDAAAETG
jgi:hypothetical protein